eukprot:snap_masked-scaffold_12-processed-gene-7.40-mRNA-1 protein AED:1.00 eAED:1.00 QI:0/-1/0/0/-1/1/1/0/1296
MFKVYFLVLLNLLTINCLSIPEATSWTRGLNSMSNALNMLKESLTDVLVEEDESEMDRYLQDAPTPCPVFDPNCGFVPTPPTLFPTTSPSLSPTPLPTRSPTSSPTFSPSATPTVSPSSAPTTSPTNSPSTTPTVSPTNSPSTTPTTSPSATPTTTPTASPSTTPTVSPTNSPSTTPTTGPSASPTLTPTNHPSTTPTAQPSQSPTKEAAECLKTEAISCDSVYQSVTATTGRGTPCALFTGECAFMASWTVEDCCIGPSANNQNDGVREIEDWFPTCSRINGEFCLFSNTTSPTVAPSVSFSPTTSPTTHAPTESPTNSPTPDTFLCQERDVCSVSSQVCQIDGECSSNVCDDGLCTATDSTMVLMWFMVALISAVTLLMFSCCFCNCVRLRNARIAAAARLNKMEEKRLGQNMVASSGIGNAGEFKERCEGLLTESIRFKEALSVQFQNVNAVKFRAGLEKAIWMHSVLTISAMIYSHTNSEDSQQSRRNRKGSRGKSPRRRLGGILKRKFSTGESGPPADKATTDPAATETALEDAQKKEVKFNVEKMTARNANHFLSDLHQVSQRLWYALDVTHSSESRQKEIEKAITELKLAVNLLPVVVGKSLEPRQIIQNDTYDHTSTKWGWNSVRLTKLEKVACSLKPSFVSLPSRHPIGLRRGRDQDEEEDVVPARGHCIRFWRHKVFYTLFFTIFITIFVSFLYYIQFDDPRSELDGRTFFGLPPQYFGYANSNLEETESVQGTIVPLIYGIMHCALFCLALLPLPICRGIWRELAYKVPTLNKYIPINDFDYIHQRLGMVLLGCLLTGAILWVVTMTIDCLNEVENACVSFDPILNVEEEGSIERLSFYNPKDNVIILRIIVLSLWFPFLPLIFWAKNGGNFILVRNIAFLKNNWYEICYYSHIFVSVVAVLIAIAARFEVFFVVIPSWLLYFVDRFLDRVAYTVNVDLSERIIFSRESNRALPNSLRLKFVPVKRRLNVRAGQWVYLQVASLDLTWHPFSLASASSDQAIELHVGVIDYSLNSKNKTWTGRLFDKVNVAKPELKARIMGPYGWAFTSCFNGKKYSGSVVIGAGTGLTAAESVLREFIFLKKLEIQRQANSGKLTSQLSSHNSDEGFGSGKRVPGKVWFVWTCKEVDDLLWCWSNLVTLIVDLCQQKVVDVDCLSVPYSNMLDWLGVTIFVTRANKDVMEDFKNTYHIFQETSAADGKVDSTIDVEKKVKNWLYTRIIEGGIADPDTHIARFLYGCRRVLDETEEERNRGLSVSFCGPSAMSMTIQDAVNAIPGNTKIEFSADHL